MNIKYITRKFTIMITIISMIIASFTFMNLSTEVFALSNNEFDSSKLQNEKKANSWQIASGEYDNNNYLYGSDKAVRVQKNVISTDVENKFQMLLNIEPQVTWDEIMKTNTITVDNNNGQGESHPSYLYPNYDRDTAPHRATVVYYILKNNVKEIISEVEMFHNTQKVPNGKVNVSNPLLNGGDPLTTIYDVDWKGDNPIVHLDISKLYSSYEFVEKRPVLDKVEDKMGSLISFDNIETVDGQANFSKVSNTLTWTINNKEEDLEFEEIRDDSGNLIGYKPIGCIEVIENGKKTYYRDDYYRLLYNFTLDTSHQDFVSYKKYDANIKAELTYTAEDKNSSVLFEVPQVRGLLYDLNIKKVDSNDTTLGLQGAKFSLSDGNNVIEKTSDKNGVIEFPENRTGSYVLTETIAPDGYEMPENNTMDILMNYTQLILDEKATGDPTLNDINHYVVGPIIIKNEMELGILKIQKQVITEDSLSLEGYQVQIRGITNDNKVYQQDIVIQANEVITLVVPKGQYTISEIVPMEYSSSIDHPSVTISPSNKEQIVTITNTFEHIGYFHDKDSRENVFRATVE